MAMLDATAAASTEVDVAETLGVGVAVEEVSVAVGSIEVEEVEEALMEFGVSSLTLSAAGIVDVVKGATVVDVDVDDGVSVVRDDDEVSRDTLEAVVDTVTVAVEVKVSVEVIVLVYPVLVLDVSATSAIFGTNFIWTLSESARWVSSSLSSPT